MFKIAKEAKKWFSGLDSFVDYDFDYYYYCLMVGLARGDKEPLDGVETTDLVRSFPGEYKAEGKLIISLFLKVELTKLGIDFNNKESLHSNIKSLIDPYSQSDLSSEGHNLMNRYSYAGFLTLQEEFEERPKNEAFFVKYRMLVKNLSQDTIYA